MFFESNELLELNEYLNYVNSLKKVSNKDLEILLENLNEENKKRFYYGYLRKVVAYAKKIYERYQKYCEDYYSLMDLIQDGNLLLWDTINNDLISNSMNQISIFNYAIYSRLNRKMLESFIVKKTFHIVSDYETLLEGENQFYQDYGYWPNDYELSQYTGVNTTQINYMRSIFQKKISFYSKEICDINDGDVVEDKVVSELYNKALCQEIMSIDSLKELEKEVLFLRLGIVYDETKKEIRYTSPMTLEEISKRHPYTREWMRQTYRSGLKKVLKLHKRIDLM